MMACYVSLLFATVFVFCELLTSLQGKPPPTIASLQGHRVKLPPPSQHLIAENNLRRRNKNNTDCHFGRSVYEIEDVWHPDLGPPFGVMYCIRCECQATQRKRRIIGKVKCQNIKNDCLEPKCAEPVLLTGKCCKTCPQDLIDTMPSEGVTGLTTNYDEGHEYASLLISEDFESTLVTQTPTLASGRFVLHKRNLHYSVQYVGPEQPSKVHFTDEKGTILEEHDAHFNHLFNTTYKVCGVWPKIPRVYRKQLQDGGIYVRLISETFLDGIVIGQIIKISAGKKETFSTLLTNSGSTDDPRRGGMAIITTLSSSNVAHFLLIFHNLIPELNGKDGVVYVSVRLESIQRDDADDNVIEEALVPVSILKPSYDNVVTEFNMNFGAKGFRQMTRGKLLLSIAPQHSPEIRLSGIISPRVSCNVYHAVLSAAADSTDDEIPPYPGAGQAVMLLAEDGSIVFRIQVAGLMSPVQEVVLETQNKKRWRLVYDLTAEYQNGWANGTLARLSARDIESLIQEEFYIRIGTESYPNHLRGLVKQRLFGNAHSGDFPLLLSSGNSVAAGQAWMAVDSSCHLYFEAVVSGVGNKKYSKKDVQEVGVVEVLDGSSAEGNLRGEPLLRVDFSGTEIDEDSSDLEGSDFAFLASGNAVFHMSMNVTTAGSINHRIDLNARIHNLHVPSKCLPDRTDFSRDDPTIDTGDVKYDRNKCFHEDRLLDDASQWTQSRNVCVMCSCQRGKIICDSEVCPTVSCSNARIYPGECCPWCPGNSSVVDNGENETNRGCYFDGDKKFHRAGHTWHPYIYPFGFSRCAICTCNAVTLQVVCNQTICPQLSCPDKDAYRENDRACCKVCPPSITKVTAVTSNQADQGRNKSDQEILGEGGCKFGKQIIQNGKEWHPRVQPFGEMLCVKCRCKDGEAKCKKPKCPHLKCQNKIISDNECCPKCSDGSSHGPSPSRSWHHRGKHGA